jgi:Zn-dependent peptidase ImmA (M78 family)/transcriptional regulator with XRE-family HTH domain
MNSQRLKQLRLARGFSLEELAAQMGGIVTKQALSKYELDKDTPSPRVLDRLAAALGVKAIRLLDEPTTHVEFIAYRKHSRMGKHAQQQLESHIQLALENRLRLQMLTQPEIGLDLPAPGNPVTSAEEAEQVAEALRQYWELGRDAIPCVTDVLESHHVHVVEVDTNTDFDGLSAIAQEHERFVAAAVITRSGTPGERQRFNLCHELGHLLLKADDDKLAEKAAHRFAGAFLAPQDTLKHAIGNQRMFIQLEELLLLKRQFGMSAQALLHRMRDLQIITESYYKQWCIDINQHGWRTNEPDALPHEQSIWLRQHVLRAFTEGVISRDEATELLGKEIDGRPSLKLIERRAFLKLPIEERRRILNEQAAQAASSYEADHEWQGGDVVDY